MTIASSTNTSHNELGNDLTTVEQGLDNPEAVWSRLYRLRKQRAHLNQRLKLFIRITILFGTAVLIAGIDPLNLQWWFALIPLILMIVNMVLIAIIRGKVRLLESEETHLLQKLRPARIPTSESLSIARLSAPPPTYNIAAVEPPAYFNPMKAPSYATLPSLRMQASQMDVSDRSQTLALDLSKVARPHSSIP